MCLQCGKEREILSLLDVTQRNKERNGASVRVGGKDKYGEEQGKYYLVNKREERDGDGMKKRRKKERGMRNDNEE